MPLWVQVPSPPPSTRLPRPSLNVPPRECLEPAGPSGSRKRTTRKRGRCWVATPGWKPGVLERGPGVRFPSLPPEMLGRRYSVLATEAGVLRDVQVRSLLSDLRVGDGGTGRHAVKAPNAHSRSASRFRRDVAQLVEQRIPNPPVGSSTLSVPATLRAVGSWFSDWNPSTVKPSIKEGSRSWPHQSSRLAGFAEVRLIVRRDHAAMVKFGRHARLRASWG